MLKEASFPTQEGERYPMDFYSNEGGQWTNFWKANEELRQKKAAKMMKTHVIAVEE